MPTLQKTTSDTFGHLDIARLTPQAFNSIAQRRPELGDGRTLGHDDHTHLFTLKALNIHQSATCV